MVLHVATDRQALAYGDPEWSELLLEADSGQHQQHRRLVRAGGEDHLALGAQLLGFVNVDGQGQYGIEGAENPLLAGLPVEVPGVTVNRLCASGLNPHPKPSEIPAAETDTVDPGLGAGTLLTGLASMRRSSL